jgi:DNA-binding MarR family transcriptional regulator
LHGLPANCSIFFAGIPLPMGRGVSDDWANLMSLEEVTVTRKLRPLLHANWVATRASTDRREKLVAVTTAGSAKLMAALPMGKATQCKMKSHLPSE